MRYALLLALSLTVAAPVLGQNVVLLRHAEKADDGTSDPPLTAYGTARAQALIGVLAASGLDVAITSGLRRTVETAAPAVAHFGADTLTVGVRGGRSANLEQTAAAVRAQSQDATVLVTGHSNTIPAIIGALGGPELPDLDESEYDLLYFLDLNQEVPVLRKIYWRPIE